MEKDVLLEQISKRIDGNDEDVKSLRESRHDHNRRIGNIEGRLAQMAERISAVAEHNEKLEKIVQKLEGVVESNTKAVRDLITTLKVSAKMLKLFLGFIGFALTAAIAAYSAGLL